MCSNLSSELLTQKSYQEHGFASAPLEPIVDCRLQRAVLELLVQDMSSLFMFRFPHPEPKAFGQIETRGSAFGMPRNMAKGANPQIATPNVRFPNKEIGRLRNVSGEKPL